MNNMFISRLNVREHAHGVTSRKDVSKDVQDRKWDAVKLWNQSSFREEEVVKIQRMINSEVMIIILAVMVWFAWITLVWHSQI